VTRATLPSKRAIARIVIETCSHGQERRVDPACTTA
jgi:hypothetical protein